jgi:hypothetical protein
VQQFEMLNGREADQGRGVANDDHNRPSSRSVARSASNSSTS